MQVRVAFFFALVLDLSSGVQCPKCLHSRDVPKVIQRFLDQDDRGYLYNLLGATGKLQEGSDRYSWGLFRAVVACRIPKSIALGSSAVMSRPVSWRQDLGLKPCKHPCKS